MDGRSKPRFVRGKDMQKLMGVSSWALRNWAKAGKIKYMRTPGGHRLYELPDVDTPLPNPKKPKRGIVYARVSSHKQQDDLQRQIAFLSAKFPDHIVLYDIASGINWKRKGLKTILELADTGDINEVVVAAKDRLCRFAFELLELVLSKRGVRITALESTDVSEEQELADDLLSIVQIFCCRRNGKRRYSVADAENKTQPKPTTAEET